MSTAKQNVAAFHTWHSPRTYNPGHPQLDPWMRDVLLSLQQTLNLLAEQADRDSERIADLERQVARLRRSQ
ncbi:MAG: hypothetical protein D3X82_14005 [Candidatus Leucobacter sulfamidivorax]|nr:hypothetical protein [Candidatus Leucobacter sulfamidivorax]